MEITRANIGSFLLKKQVPLRLAAILLTACLLIGAAPVWMQKLVIRNQVHEQEVAPVDSVQLAATARLLEKDLNRLNRTLQYKLPRSGYLVINSSSNEFTLFRGTKVIRQGRCSTGSYTLLKNGPEQEWMFKTPKGEFRIRGKTSAPVWKKPDWAFVEEGLPVPSEDHHTRFEYGVLGDYALSLGDGYLIHGTLYQRFLGLPVTHGCIRLGDADLEAIYFALGEGSKVFIY